MQPSLSLQPAPVPPAAPVRPVRRRPSLRALPRPDVPASGRTADKALVEGGSNGRERDARKSPVSEGARSAARNRAQLALDVIREGTGLAGLALWAWACLRLLGAL